MQSSDKPGVAAGFGSVDLLNERLGGRALACSDDRFASMHCLVQHKEPSFTPESFGDQGQIYSGWESGRNYRRSPDHVYDWCVLQLGAPGRIDLVDIDTSFFKGNYPAYAEIEACYLKATSQDGDSLPWNNLPWRTILKRSPLKGHSHNLFSIKDERVYTHLRIKAFPDGGIARLRAYGEVRVDWTTMEANKDLELSSTVLGGAGVAASDMFYSPISNMLNPGRAENMGQGWETARKRGPGHNWAIIRLAHAGFISRLEVDTNHFKNNAPAACSVDAVCAVDSVVDFLTFEDFEWQTILPVIALKPHHQHWFELETPQKCSHLRLNIYPDGGISRFRAFGSL
jgi:allantoicase